MKKFFAFLLTATMLVSMFVVVAPAADISYTITGVNTPVTEGGVVVCDDLDTWAESNPIWSMNVQLTPNGDKFDVIWSSSCPIEQAAKNADQWDASANDGKGGVKEGYVPTAKELKDASGFSDNEDDLYVIIHGKYEVGFGMTAEIDNVDVNGTITFSGAASGNPVQKKVRVDNNVAAGKSYETSLLYRQGDASNQWGYMENNPINYPDTGNKELTDRYVQDDTSYSNGALVGLHYNTPDAAEKGYAWVKVDLGKEITISEARLYMPVEADGGIGTSDVTFVGYKADGTEVALGENVPKADCKKFSDSCVYAAVEVEATVRYVEARIYRGGWCMVSEIVVIEKVEENNDPNPEVKPEVKPEPKPEVKPEAPSTNIDELLGEANENAAFDAVLTIDPSNYVAGEKITVNVSIKNLPETGIDDVEFVLNYDATKVDLAEELAGSAISVFNGFAEWEDLSVFEEEGKLVLHAGTAGGDKGNTFTFAKNDDEITFSVDFTVKADATGDIAAWIPHESVVAYFTDGGNDYVGNGSGMAITAAVAESTGDDATDDSTNDEPVPGDASSMIFFAIIALVAIAGSAVVIKTRK